MYNILRPYTMLITLLVHVCTCVFKIQLARTLLEVTISYPTDVITEHGLSYLLAAQQQIFPQLRETHMVSQQSQGIQTEPDFPIAVCIILLPAAKQCWPVLPETWAHVANLFQNSANISIIPHILSLPCFSMQKRQGPTVQHVGD